MKSVPDIQQLESLEQEIALTESHIKAKAVPGMPLQILEAGCGQRWSLNLDQTKYILTGVDLDRDALEIRKNVQGDLHEAILGDLCCIDLGINRFDVIYSAFVLEHVQRADKVLNNFSRWVKPGGLVVLKIPDPQSVRGFVTRVTPHWLHVLYYRVLGNKNAGKAGFPPYVTFYHPLVSQPGIHQFCITHNLTIREECGDGGYQPFGRGLVARAARLFVQTIAAVSFGNLTSRHTNLLYILEKEA
jgi:SAM-dependent methyltransferase